MTPTAGGPRAAADLQDELDELLVEYLSKLDVYQGVQERLSGELKKVRAGRRRDVGAVAQAETLELTAVALQGLL